MSLRRGLGALLGALAALLPAGARAASPLDPPAGMTVERVVMLYRHGLRAPLPDEIGARAYAVQPWPAWSTPASLVTPHGAAALRQLGRYDRTWFARLGLVPETGCLDAAQVAIWTNTEARTVSSGHDLAEGLAPGCGLPAAHLPLDRRDPLFDAGAAVRDFDGAGAVRTIEAETGGPAALIAPDRDAVGALEDILGCRAAPHPCDIAAAPASLTASRDGHGLALTGPIMVTSGTASVFLLEYAEGWPMPQVGWGRATPARLAEVSRLHALLFDVFDRSSAMRWRTAAALAPRVSQLLASGPPATLLVGHDNNIAALAAILGVHFAVPGYAPDDPPLGGALGFEVLRDRAGERWARVFYQAQSLDQLRTLAPLTPDHPPAEEVLQPRCAQGRDGLCRLADLQARLHRP